MKLEKLYYCYGLDTSCFYTDEEAALERRINNAKRFKNRLKAIRDKTYHIQGKIYRNKIKQSFGSGYTAAKKEIDLQFCNRWYEIIEERYSFDKFLHRVNTAIRDYKQQLLDLQNKNLDVLRTVRYDKIHNRKGEPSMRRRVSIFDSALTRCLDLKERKFNTEIVIVKVFYFPVAHNILRNGFIMDGQKYVFFSASAGQIRTKKFVAVREDLLNACWNTLTAGLTIERINELGGMNINKALAYLALANSGTEEWQHFDINRCIVVDDFETNVEGEVDFIDDVTFEITRQRTSLPIAQMDGCGIMLPRVSKKNFMVRLPFVKGLLAVFDFEKFIRDNNAIAHIKDIYGQEHDIIKENIEIILTKSQFKMYKFYTSWQEYKDNFKKYNCQACICNVEEDYFSDAVINYQMIQTLCDLTDDEIDHLTQINRAQITDLTTNQDAMLKTFGINKYKPVAMYSGLQKCLQAYPILVSDVYCRAALKDLQRKLETELWSAKFAVQGKYTFVVPDLYAFCEWLFLGIKNPRGLLRDGEVSCRLFKDGEKIDCLRSPHLYCEHAVRKNRLIGEWFTTKAIYVSSHDYISRILQMDYDGDCLLLCNDKVLINAAERNMQGKVPLYYYARKATATIITPDSLWGGLNLAFSHSNIGEISNAITKIWNGGEITEEKLKVIKWLVMLNNFRIDYAKTLYYPEIPNEIRDTIAKYTKCKLPHFFIYAKGKNKSQVEPPCQSVVDRLSGRYPTKRMNFNFSIKNVGRFDHNVLMTNDMPDNASEIVEQYKLVVREKLDLSANSYDDNKNYLAVYANARDCIVSAFPDNTEEQIVNAIIQSIFCDAKSVKKKAFWQMFGDVVYQNIVTNLNDGLRMCERCHTRFMKIVPNQKYCSKCQGYIKLNFKVIRCVDCGSEFEVNSKNTKSERCPACYAKYRKNYQRELMYNKRNI